METDTEKRRMDTIVTREDDPRWGPYGLTRHPDGGYEMTVPLAAWRASGKVRTCRCCGKTSDVRFDIDNYGFCKACGDVLDRFRDFGNHSLRIEVHDAEGNLVRIVTDHYTLESGPLPKDCDDDGEPIRGEAA